MDQESPIVIGLAGLAGTGKTTIANTIVPLGQDLSTRGPFQWDHMFFAMPLYTLATIKKKTSGANAQNRITHLIHQQLFSLFQASELPPYEDVVRLVEVAASYQLPRDEKPRTFLQKVGNMCRDLNPDCFALYLRQRALLNFMNHFEEDNNIPPYAVIISDLRYPNEAEMVNQFPNGMVIKLVCETEERERRLYARDGVVLTEEQANHTSEISVALIPEELITTTIDTTHMSFDEQATEVVKLAQSL